MDSAAGFAWDSSSLINLVASGCIDTILRDLLTPSFTVRRVLEKEVIYLRSEPGEG